MGAGGSAAGSGTLGAGTRLRGPGTSALSWGPLAPSALSWGPSALLVLLSGVVAAGAAASAGPAAAVGAASAAVTSWTLVLRCSRSGAVLVLRSGGRSRGVRERRRSHGARSGMLRIAVGLGVNVGGGKLGSDIAGGKQKVEPGRWDGRVRSTNH